MILWKILLWKLPTSGEFSMKTFHAYYGLISRSSLKSTVAYMNVNICELVNIWGSKLFFVWGTIPRLQTQFKFYLFWPTLSQLSVMKSNLPKCCFTFMPSLNTQSCIRRPLCSTLKFVYNCSTSRPHSIDVYSSMITVGL